MTKTIVGGLVAGIILFIWQFASWGLIEIHASNMEHTPNQEKILAVLSENLTEGEYFIPRAPVGAPQEAAEAIQKAGMGKPWAQVYYHDSLDMNMGSMLFRGFTLDFFIGILLCWLFGKFADPHFSNVLISTIVIGLIGYLSISYLNSVWFSTNSLPYLIDAIGSFGLVGAWLGWWLNR